MRDRDPAKQKVAWVYFAARVRRKLQDQHVILLAHLESSAPGRGVSFITRTCDDMVGQDAEVLSFVTPWGLAREFAMDGSSCLIADRAVMKNSSSGDMVYVRAVECGQVHPYIKPPKAKTTTSAFHRLPDINKVEEQPLKKQKQKAKRGKVYVGRIREFRARVANKKDVRGCGSSSASEGDASSDERIPDDINYEVGDGAFNPEFGPVKVVTLYGQEVAFQISNAQAEGEG